MSFPPLVTAQIAGILLVFATLALLPPTTGRMILIPLRDDNVELLDVALANGGSVIGRGPFAGSLVIQGRRGALLGTLYHHHVLMLAAPYVGCGAAA